MSDIIPDYSVHINVQPLHPSLEATGLGRLCGLYPPECKYFEFGLDQFFKNTAMTNVDRTRAARFIRDLIDEICKNGTGTRVMVRNLVVPQIYEILNQIFDCLILNLDAYDVLILVEDEDEDSCDVGSLDGDYPAEEEDDEFDDQICRICYYREPLGRCSFCLYF